MKRIVFSLMISILVFTGCNQYEYNEPIRQLKVTETALDFYAAANSGYILVESNAALTAASDAAWCTVQVDGKKINVSVTANSGIESRTATVCIRANSDSVNVPVTQQASRFIIEYLYFSTGFNAAELKTSIVFDNPISSVSSEASWISATFEENVIYLSISKNTGAQAREGRVKVTSGSISQYIVVKQERGLELTAQITINDLNVMRANITITPGPGVATYAVLVAAKEMYQDFVDEYTEGDEVLFMEMVGELYETGDPTTEAWNLNGSTDYDYYAVVLLYDDEGNPYPEVVKHEFTSPAFQEGLPEASATITVSDVTATSARIAVAPDANAFGFYDGLFTKEEFDATVAQSGEDYVLDYLAMFGDLYIAPEEDDWEWEGLEPATEYIMVAVPFNANGADGYGNLVTETFTTLAATASSSAAKSKAHGERERKKHKKALTAETVKLLNLKKK
jgi:hypothetical protein